MRPQSRDKSLHPAPVPPRRHALRWMAAALLVALGAIAFSLWDSQRQPASSAASPRAAAVAVGAAPLSVERTRRAYTSAVPLAQRLPFFSPFTSYASVDEISGVLHAARYEVERRARHADVPPRLPPNNLDTLYVAGYRHLGEPGQLELQFFNDRLYQLEFEPADAQAYRQKFRTRWSNLRREKNGRSERVQGSLRIASSLDLATSEVGRALQTRPFVLWQDLRLIRQRDDWNLQFAREAIQ